MFSGRRGVHCWVSDYEARILDGPGRGAVADYMCLIMGGDNIHKKVHLGTDNLHTSIKYVILFNIHLGLLYYAKMSTELTDLCTFHNPIHKEFVIS